MYLFELSICVLRHPIDVFSIFKRKRESKSVIPAFTFLILFVIVRLISIFITHFPLQTTNPLTANIFLEIAFYFVPPFTWAIASFAISSIMDGESLISENLTAAAFSLMPYIVFQIPISLLSNILTIKDAGFYNFLSTFIMVWCAILFIVSIKTINDFSLRKTFLVVFLTIFTMFLCWGVAVLVYALLSQFIAFLTGLYREILFAIRNY